MRASARIFRSKRYGLKLARRTPEQIRAEARTTSRRDALRGDRNVGLLGAVAKSVLSSFRSLTLQSVVKYFKSADHIPLWKGFKDTRRHHRLGSLLTRLLISLLGTMITSVTVRSVTAVSVSSLVMPVRTVPSRFVMTVS